MKPSASLFEDVGETHVPNERTVMDHTVLQQQIKQLVTLPENDAPILDAPLRDGSRPLLDDLHMLRVRHAAGMSHAATVSNPRSTSTLATLEAATGLPRAATCSRNWRTTASLTNPLC